jgi:hypothetical protein
MLEITSDLLLRKQCTDESIYFVVICNVLLKPAGFLDIRSDAKYFPQDRSI